MNIVRNTSMYFQPQIRTKTINEGWASYWHDRLFRGDPRITGHESDYAKTNAMVTSISRVGLNPYAIGLRLIEHIEELADKGKMDYDFQEISDMETRNAYNKHTGKGLDTIFRLRETFSDFMLFNTFVSQDFVDKHKLFVTGRHLDPQRGVWQYYVKSRKAADYKQMLTDSLYHPPHVFVSKDKSTEDNLYLVHSFEGKQLLEEFIPNVLIGLEYLWGGQVQLETTRIIVKKQRDPNAEPEKQYKEVIYTCKDRKVTKKEI
jgi:stage V sporulation protein R